MEYIPLSQLADVNPRVSIPRGRRVPFISMDDVKADLRDVRSTTPREFAGGSKFEDGDTLFARITPCLENGKIARASVPVGDGIGAGSTEFVVLRGRDGVSDSDFVYYLMRDPDVRDAAIARMEGTSGRQRVSASFFTDHQVPFPPLPQQRAIAEVLGALDDKIAANTKLAETLNLLASIEFEEARQRAGDSALLSDLVTTQYGLTTSAHHLPGPKLLRVTDINKKPWIEWTTTPHCTVSESDLAKYQVEAGDILVARMADPGKAAFVDYTHPEAVFASYLVRLRAHDPSSASYIYYFLRSAEYLRYADGATQGTVQRNMNAKVIVAAEIPLPTSVDIVKFAEAVRPLRMRIGASLLENENLAATRDALLPQLMSGKLRVRDAERTLEGVL